MDSEDIAYVLNVVKQDLLELHKLDYEGRTVTFVASITPFASGLYTSLVGMNPPICRERHGASPFGILAARIVFHNIHQWDLQWAFLDPIFELLSPLRPDGSFATEVDGNNYIFSLDRWVELSIDPVPALRTMFLAVILCGANVDRSLCTSNGTSERILCAVSELHPDLDTAKRGIALAINGCSECGFLKRLRAPTRYQAPPYARVSNLLKQFYFPPPCDEATYNASAGEVITTTLPFRMSFLSNKEREDIFFLFCIGHWLANPALPNENRPAPALPNEIYVIIADFLAPMRRPSRLPVYSPIIDVADVDFSLVTKPRLLYTIRHHCAAFEYENLKEGFDVHNAEMHCASTPPQTLIDDMSSRIFVYLVTRMDTDHVLLKPGIIDRIHVKGRNLPRVVSANGDFETLIDLAERKETKYQAPSYLLRDATYAASCPFTPALVGVLADMWNHVHPRKHCLPKPCSYWPVNKSLIATSTSKDDFAELTERAVARAKELGLICIYDLPLSGEQ